MFTGIVEELGTVKKLTLVKNLATLEVKVSAKFTKGLKAGESVAVNGVCLTVVSVKAGILTFEIIKESLEKTTLGKLTANSKVNLERALKADSRLGGHFVTGHIDGVGTITKTVTLPNYLEYEVKIPLDLRRYIVPKGSICIDGISLTVGYVHKDSFTFYVIPYTLKVTNLGSKKIGDRVNLETDILAKYVLEGMLEANFSREPKPENI